MTRIMIIRHAEKHHDGGHERGVDVNGSHDNHELTVRGWQRAGALVRFFAPQNGSSVNPLISTPRTIFASAATKHSPSKRSQRTVEPLAAALGVFIDMRFEAGDEAGVASAAVAAPSPVLICWHHSHIPVMAKLFGGVQVGCPDEWPEERFDVVWILDRDEDAGGAWRFAQVPQRLLPHDRDEAF
jgi:hypothetical protein